MGQVRQRQRAVAMDRVGHQPVAVDHPPVVAEDRVFVGPVGGVDDAAFEDDDPDAARGARAVVGGVPLLEAIMGGEVGLMRGEDEAVRRRRCCRGERREETLVVVLLAASGHPPSAA